MNQVNCEVSLWYPDCLSTSILLILALAMYPAPGASSPREKSARLIDAVYNLHL